MEWKDIQAMATHLRELGYSVDNMTITQITETYIKATLNHEEVE